MASVNKVMLLGNVTRDPELRHLQSGMAVCDVGLAMNESYKDKNGERKEEAVFVDVTFWGKTAEIAAQYLAKGRQAHVEGRLKLDTWEDKKTGEKRSKLKVTGDRLTLVGGKPEGGGGQAQRPSSPAPQDDDEYVPF